MEENKSFKDKRGREWECFADESYYGMWCIRCIDAGKDFNSHLAFHFIKATDALAFGKLIKESS